jgi:putative N6-adenine-specific DNA methylase
VLAVEMTALGLTGCKALPGGVSAEGDRRAAYRVNLHSRLASRVLVEMGRRRYRNDDDLYKLANAIEWERHFDARHSLRVDTSATRSPLRSLNFATLRIKDGICDRLRDRTGERPSIDTRAPDARVWLFLDPREAIVYLDFSGEPLFKRGWRSDADDRGDAPLKENLAAGLLALAGWTPDIPLVDPFCGSGTIVIEAASLAHDLAPGLSRPFGFEKLLDHDPELWRSLRLEAEQRARTGATGRFRISGSDIDAGMIDRARRNLARAGLPDHAVQWRTGDLSRLSPPFGEPGMILCNPPYGERIGALHDGNTVGRHLGGAVRNPDSHPAVMASIGRQLRQSWGGWRAWLLSSDPDLPLQLGMKERRRTPLFNGAIECRLYGFEIFARQPGAAA